MIEQKELLIAEGKQTRTREELAIEGDTAYYIYIATSIPEQGREYVYRTKFERDNTFNLLAAHLNPLVFTPNSAEQLRLAQMCAAF